MTDSRLAWALCAHVTHRLDANGREEGAPFRVWHKVAGPWSLLTFCGQNSRWMAPRKWLRTTNLIGRPARTTEPDVEPFGHFCEICQATALHHLIPPGFPRFREPADALIAGDWWLDAGDEQRSELCRAIADPHWRPTMSSISPTFGPWGRATGHSGSHLFRRIGATDPYDCPDLGFHLTFQSTCDGVTAPAMSIDWEYNEQRLPCRECTATLHTIDGRPAVIAHYTPYNRRRRRSSSA